ncbi:MAG: GyrI-like domain-containing protein [Bacteroidetes bacterium]|nr:GyrI-like domain-containing protein [Bacteroidota bacterium]
MDARIEIINEKKLVGKRIQMSFTDNKTFDLWHSFMSQRDKIRNNIGTALYSVEVYAHDFFLSFDTGRSFDKWAAIEVSVIDSIPEGMESLIIPEGSYAVFLHKGPASEGGKTYHYIFDTWLPNSEYLLDNRPHFAVMGSKYKYEAADSEEEIWIPIKTI